MCSWVFNKDSYFLLSPSGGLKQWATVKDEKSENMEIVGKKMAGAEWNENSVLRGTPNGFATMAKTLNSQVWRKHRRIFIFLSMMRCKMHIHVRVSSVFVNLIHAISMTFFQRTGKGNLLARSNRDLLVVAVLRYMLVSLWMVGKLMRF